MAQKRLDEVQSVIRVASGNFLEMYDFMIFGYFDASCRSRFDPAGAKPLSVVNQSMCT